MKKTIVAVAALAFALGAFADGVPSVSWFTATPGNLDDGAWTLTPTAAEPLVEGNVWVVDTETPGEDDAIYTPKELKADKKTRVALNIAFGAAYAKDELPSKPTDAQTGLVLGIDGGETNFYGLVSGGWKKLAGGVPEDLDMPVDVTVEIDYEANPVTLSFKVGNAVLEDATDHTVTTFERYAGTDATSLASVGFAGSGKIASIAGNADPKYVVGSTGYLDFAAAVTAAAGASAIELYYNTEYEFPSTGNSVLKVKPTGAYTFTPNYGTAFKTAVTDEDVTTYTVKNTASFSGGDGHVGSPYIIANATDFAELAHFAVSDAFNGKLFAQTAAITATVAIPQFEGIYDANGNQLSSTAEAIFTTANGATFNKIAFSGALIGTATSVTATGCTMTEGTAVKPVTNGSVAGLTFATLANGVYTFCAAPSVAGMYYVMLDSDAAITFGKAVDDELTLTSVAGAAYTGTVGTEVAQAKVVKNESTYTVAWDKIEITLEDAEHGSVEAVTATGSGVDPTSKDNVWTVVRGDTVTVTYKAAEGYVFSGKTTTADVVLENVDVNPKIVLPTFVVGKAKYNGELYDTVQNAVNAAEVNSQIVIVADSTDPVSIGKAVSFTGDADYVVGAITLTEGGTLTIEKGKYDVLNPVTTDNLVLMGGFFTDEAATIQTYCSLGYFAKEIVGTGYRTAVKKGEVITPEPSSEVPAIAVEPGFIPEGTPDKVEYLKEEQANQQPRWVNYALGLDGTDSTATVELADKGDADTISIDLAAGALKAGTGLTAKYETADGTEWKPFDPEIALDDETPVSEVATIRLVLKDAAGKDFVVKEVDYGLKSETPTAGLSVISVPFTELGSENGLPLDKVLKLKNIAEGDKIYRYDADEGKNVAWELKEGQWDGDMAPIVKPGEGLWLERADNSKPVYFFGGFQAAKDATPVAANKWALVANPSLTAALSLDKIIPSPTADMQVTIETGAEPKIFTYEDGAWGYNKKETTKRMVGKREVSVTTVKRVENESVIAPGQGFWFANGEAETSLNWNNND